jgi:hypothetical protein
MEVRVVAEVRGMGEVGEIGELGGMGELEDMVEVGGGRNCRGWRWEEWQRLEVRGMMTEVGGGRMAETKVGGMAGRRRQE